MGVGSLDPCCLFPVYGNLIDIMVRRKKFLTLFFHYNIQNYVSKYEIISLLYQ